MRMSGNNSMQEMTRENEDDYTQKKGKLTFITVIAIAIIVAIVVIYNETKEIKIIISPQTTTDSSGIYFFIKSASLNGRPINTASDSSIVVRPHKKYTLVWTTANKNGFGMYLNEETYMREIKFSKKDNEKYLTFWRNNEMKLFSIQEYTRFLDELNRVLNENIKEMKKKLKEIEVNGEAEKKE